ncbi:hypothetical protein Igag_0729 [Ignisphaera aggregans DSM 17230]|uniref:Uncharacterized protein n=1 Tax=Ignisphaera aggregans (strain DSM 17230 / JCM 13409 / AQ1.S1) TaxID=583356 RepID=E0ST82_IGNAA|nr:hypothetical protein Igag_0729 [Ignisphaera aggregans DSM 17230]
MGETEKIFTIRFFTRSRKHRNPIEVVYFYDNIGSRVFSAYCEYDVVSSFLERFDASVKRSRSGKTIYLEGPQAEDIFRRLVIFTGFRQCVKSSSKALQLGDAIVGIGEFEAIFWYSKIVNAYENEGFWGVCRIAKAFRILHRID